MMRIPRRRWVGNCSTPPRSVILGMLATTTFLLVGCREHPREAVDHPFGSEQISEALWIHCNGYLLELPGLIGPEQLAGWPSEEAFTPIEGSPETWRRNGLRLAPVTADQWAVISESFRDSGGRIVAQTRSVLHSEKDFAEYPIARHESGTTLFVTERAGSSARGYSVNSGNGALRVSLQPVFPMAEQRIMSCYLVPIHRPSTDGMTQAENTGLTISATENSEPIIIDALFIGTLLTDKGALLVWPVDGKPRKGSVASLVFGEPSENPQPPGLFLALVPEIVKGHKKKNPW